MVRRVPRRANETHVEWVLRFCEQNKHAQRVRRHPLRATRKPPARKTA